MNTLEQTQTFLDFKVSGPPLCLYGGHKDDPLRGQWLPAAERHIKVLNFSGGKQSSLLAWLAILGEIERPDVIMSANPGMEGQAVLDYVAMIQDAARAVGIPAYTVPGPNLYEAIINLKQTQRTRFDTPAFYTKGKHGSREGRLSQRCTKWAKIAPMNRASRIEVERLLGIGRRSTHIPPGTVEKWIGFSFSEVTRIKPPVERWSCFRYPLVDLRLTNGDVIKKLNYLGKPIPKRSVCRGCFANDASFFRQMSIEDPAGWEQAKQVDRAIRDWKQIGVENEVYILRSCISLDELEARGFVDVAGPVDQGCDSGYCLT
jgi:hypothetical protein